MARVPVRPHRAIPPTTHSVRRNQPSPPSLPAEPSLPDRTRRLPVSESVCNLMIAVRLAHRGIGIALLEDRDRFGHRRTAIEIDVEVNQPGWVKSNPSSSRRRNTSPSASSGQCVTRGIPPPSLSGYLPASKIQGDFPSCLLNFEPGGWLTIAFKVGSLSTTSLTAQTCASRSSSLSPRVT